MLETAVLNINVARLVQLAVRRRLLFDAFHVGKFNESSYDPCPNGFMQIMELGRPFTGGSWCGLASGLAVYYSETSTITVTIKFFHFQDAANFQFKLRYRFLKDEQAVLRFGSPSEPLERGEPVPGTYCSRIFYECSKKRCRLQSPNFPGMYPRNITCHLSLRQKDVPTCKHAMIAVKQENSYKIQIKRSVVASMNKTRQLRTWNDCSENKDQLILYDGSSTDDPVLVKFCGGDWLPRVTSRGPEMLVVFRSTPFSVPFQSSVNSKYPFRGFELDVDVLFADSDSLDFSKETRKCDFWVNASSSDGDEMVLRSKGRMGTIVSPRHTLPPNTTCTWHFRGTPGDLVWIYFINYFHETLIPLQDSQETGPTAEKKPKTPGTSSRRVMTNSGQNCTTRLRIWDGGGSLGQPLVLGEYCDSQLPKLCDHSSLGNLTRTTRPCSLRESYLSIGSELMLQVSSEKGTALHPMSFKLKYEFVDTKLGGEQWNVKRDDEFASSPCLRIFRRKKRGFIRSPRNVFYFGKGGAKNLSCIYRIEGSPSERIKLTILNASFGENSCYSLRDLQSQRHKCVRDPGEDRIVELSVLEAPWKNVAIPHSCFCDNSTNDLSFEFASKAVEIHFRVNKFNGSDDFLNFYFNAKYEIVKSSECTRRQKVGGSGGELFFSYPPVSTTEINCYGLPWLVEGYQNMSLFLLTWGTFMELEPSPEETAKCPTKNRILIYSGRPTRLLRVVCPQKPNSHPYAVHIFSEEWFSTPSIPSTSRNGPIFHLEPPQPPSFVVEFIGFEEGIAQLNWLEISRTRRSYLQQHHMEHMIPKNLTNQNDTFGLGWDCQYKCPELNACISESLWCDGRQNCPSGYDESELHCGVGHKFISLIPGGMYAVLGASAATITFFCLFLAVLVAFKFRQNSKNGQGKNCDRNGRPRRVLTEEFLLDPDSTMSS
ncbi:hypothetical protein RUM43_001773 [Polyplax serrata]|uniref:CUB domain-containing protein n=1 Tax=Polyplax serrata TaxID=468196 RepID=A0AAN8SJ95_POLSC